VSRAATPWPARFVLLALFWGSTFLFIKIGDEALAPLQVSLGRLLVGIATLLGIVALRRERLPVGWGLWGQLAIAGLLLNVVPSTLFAYGERHVSSLLAGIWNATVRRLVRPRLSLYASLSGPAPRRTAGPRRRAAHLRHR